MEFELSIWGLMTLAGIVAAGDLVKCVTQEAGPAISSQVRQGINTTRHAYDGADAPDQRR